MRKHRVDLVHWNEAESRERLARLRKLGYTARHLGLMGPKVVQALRADPPDAVVIDLSRLPAHGREVASAFRQHKKTRLVPIVFVEGEPEKVDRIRALLPDATFTTWSRVGPALKRAMATPLADPVVPKDSMAAYSGTPLPKKLGIKENHSVALHEPPDNFRDTLGDALPANVKFCTGHASPRRLAMWFVRSLAELKRGIKSHGASAAKHDTPLWIAWPKKASGVQTDVTETSVRETGLANGLVDYKICSIDSTWSGLLFRVRKPAR